MAPLRCSQSVTCSPLGHVWAHSFYSNTKTLLSPDRTGSLYILHCHELVTFSKCQFQLRMHLIKQQKGSISFHVRSCCALCLTFWVTPREVGIQHFCYKLKYLGCLQEKHLRDHTWVRAVLADFSIEHCFYLKRRQTISSYSDVFGRHFLENKQSESVTSREATNSICC